MEGEELIIGAGHSVCHPSFVFKKSVLEEIGGYNEEFSAAEDLAYQIKFLENKKKIKVLNEKLYFVRKHNTSKSTIENVENALETMKIRTDYILQNLICKNSSILIWAYGSGGRNLYKYIIKNYPEILIKGFVDSNMFGQKIDNIEVFHPSKLDNVEIDYIFIATSPGRIEVQKILNLKGYKALKKYFSIYT